MSRHPLVTDAQIQELAQRATPETVARVITLLLDGVAGSAALDRGALEAPVRDALSALGIWHSLQGWAAHQLPKKTGVVP